MRDLAMPCVRGRCCVTSEVMCAFLFVIFAVIIGCQCRAKQRLAWEDRHDSFENADDAARYTENIMDGLRSEQDNRVHNNGCFSPSLVSFTLLVLPFLRMSSLLRYSSGTREAKSTSCGCDGCLLRYRFLEVVLFRACVLCLRGVVASFLSARASLFCFVFFATQRR